MLYGKSRPALQRNAADPKQRNRAERIERRRAQRLKAAITDVMKTQPGRLVMWELLSTCGVFRSVWEASAKIHYNAGRQDVGHELQADLHEVDTDLYLLMEKEARVLAAREQAEIEAGHTSAATDEGDEDHG
jgi:hypothetical protein